MKKRVLAILLSVLLLGLCSACSSQEVYGSKVFSTGFVSEQTWENAYVGLGFTAEEGWAYSSASALARLNGFPESKIVTEADLAALDSFYDMRVALGKRSVSVMLLKGEWDGMDLHDVMEGSFPQLRQELENAGASRVDCGVTDLTVDGRLMPASDIQIAVEDSTFYEMQFAVRCHGHVAVVTVAAPTKSDLNAILSGFYWLD